ncbi:hypothetical protein PMAYCL1PPCAC_01410, partial [Pristionchus mayeri]
SSRPLPLMDRRPPPCYECCCRPEQKPDLKRDPNWTPPHSLPPTTLSLPAAEYLVVSRDALVSLLDKCKQCVEGANHLSFHMEGLAVQCSTRCNKCGFTDTWSGSPLLKTANEGNKERLAKINVDVVTGAIITAVGGTKLRQIFLMSGISPISSTTFHRLKKHYVRPAVDELFWRTQGALIDSIRERIAKGEKIHLCGDGSFDSRGYSAAYCRYFILNAETGEVLHYIIMHKTDTGSSSTMEVAALEQGLNELALVISGIDGIASLVTDRHLAATKMMHDKFPGIKQMYDPWHFFRNITLALVKICKAKYMTPARIWVKPIINRCYDAVLSAQGNGELASEKFRAILCCISGQHHFDQDPSFKLLKECPHDPPKNPRIYLPKGGEPYKRLESQVFTIKSSEDIKSVSANLDTSPCENINALAWGFAPKDLYFIRSGHELRTRLTVLHWNHLKATAMDGSRPVVGKAASHTWRNEIKQGTYKVNSPEPMRKTQ